MLKDDEFHWSVLLTAADLRTGGDAAQQFLVLGKRSKKARHVVGGAGCDENSAAGIRSSRCSIWDSMCLSDEWCGGN